MFQKLKNMWAVFVASARVAFGKSLLAAYQWIVAKLKTINLPAIKLPSALALIQPAIEKLMETLKTLIAKVGWKKVAIAVAALVLLTAGYFGIKKIFTKKKHGPVIEDVQINSTTGSEVNTLDSITRKLK